jgi:hypothetical protein
MGGKRTVLVLSIAVVSTLGGAGVASAMPPPTPVGPAPVMCSDMHPDHLMGNGDPGGPGDPGGGQMIHHCGPR